MTAKDLYEIVKDIPAEAAPHCYGSASDGKETHWHYTRDGVQYVVDPEAVSLGYEASMTRYLIGEGWNAFLWDADPHGKTITLMLGDWGYEVSMSHGPLTHVAALAKAVLAVSKKE